MKSGVIYAQRALTNQEIGQLMVGIKNTPNITGYTRRELKKITNVHVAECEGRLAGVAITDEISEKWAELSVVFVFPSYRGMGIGKELFNRAWEELNSNKLNIYIVSRTEPILKLMREKQMQFISLSKLPWIIKKDVYRFALSYYRIWEFFRKLIVFHGAPAYQYAIKEREKNA